MVGFHAPQMVTRVWQGSGCGDSTWDLIVPKRRKIEEIWVELSLVPICFAKIRRCKSLNTEGPHKDNRSTLRLSTGYQTPEVENPYSRYDILESLVANSLWVEVGA